MPGRWWPVLFWAGGILVVTSIPGSVVPRAPRVPGLDKVVHTAMYAGLGRALAGPAALPPGRALVGAAIFGAVDEGHQGWIPGRRGDVQDWVADVIGAALGIWGLSARRARSGTIES